MTLFLFGDDPCDWMCPECRVVDTSDGFEFLEPTDADSFDDELLCLACGVIFPYDELMEPTE